MQMPNVSARDLMLAPNVVSLTRLPLALLFPFATVNPPVAFAVLLAAGLTDVVDGWLARRNGQETALGAIVDPIADKVFAITVVVTLLVNGTLPLWAVPALLVREIFEAPLLAWCFLTKRKREERPRDVRANIPGKLATVLQFAAVMAALAMPAYLTTVLAVAAAAGAFAGISYWIRELGRARRS